VICDRADTARTCEAIQFTGDNFDELRAFVGEPHLLEWYGRWCLSSPDGSVHAMLDPGDYIVQGCGPGWDYYRIKPEKFPRIWTRRNT
jgi:hypothetical protein